MTKRNEKKQEMKKCFIITPIGATGSKIQREALGIVDVVLKPLLEGLGYETISAVDFNTGQITDQILNSIYDADLVIANITEQNPNVMYELALAHAFKKLTYHIVREGERVPFDIGVHKYYEYKDDVRGTEELRQELIKALSKIDFSKDVSNPVTSSLKQYKATEREDIDVNLQDLVTTVMSLQKEVKNMTQSISSGRENTGNSVPINFSNTHTLMFDISNEDYKTKNIKKFKNEIMSQKILTVTKIEITQRTSENVSFNIEYIAIDIFTELFLETIENISKELDIEMNNVMTLPF